MAAASSANGENEKEKEEEIEEKPKPPPPAHFVCEGVVWKQHINESDVDRNPVERSQSTITYVAYLDDGDETSVGDRPFKDSSNATMFDERHRDEPITFELYPEPQENGTRYFGVEQTKCPLPILADAIKTMRPGEKATFTVKPEQAFGEEGDDELGVPPNATVKYDIFQHDFNTVELVDHDKEFLKMIIKKEDEKERGGPSEQDEVYATITLHTDPGCTPDSLVYETPSANPNDEGVESFALDEIPKHLPPATARALRTMPRTQKSRFAILNGLDSGRKGAIYMTVKLLKWKERGFVKGTKNKVLKLAYQLDDEAQWARPTDFSTVKFKMISAHDAVTGEQLLGETDEETVTLHSEQPDLPEALEAAARHMRMGETAHITVTDLRLAYEDPCIRQQAMCLPKTCTSRRVMYVAKLIEIVEKGMEIDTRALEDKGKDGFMEEAEKRKALGTAAMKRGANERAVLRYNDALKFAAKTPDDMSQPIRLALHLNNAMVYLRMNEFSLAKQSCEWALEIDPENIKGIFRRAKAHEGLIDYDLAAKDLKEAIRLEPQNRDLRKEYEDLKLRAKEDAKKQRELWGSAKIFDKERGL